MQLDGQKRLERGRRLIPVFAALGLVYLGVTLFVVASPREMIVSLLTVAICGLAGILALGLASIRLRRVIFSHEERIQRLELQLRQVKEDNAVE